MPQRNIPPLHNSGSQAETHNLFEKPRPDDPFWNRHPTAWRLSPYPPPAPSVPRSWGRLFSARAGCAFPVGTDTSASIPRSTLACGRPRVCVTKSPAGDRKTAFIMELLSQIAYWAAYTLVVGGGIVFFGGQIVRDTVEMLREQPRDEEQTDNAKEETL